MSLLILPWLIAATAHPSMLVFIVFYGLDWVATVPPTIALCRQHFGADGPIVFGWVFASHQFGAAVAATGAGLLRDMSGEYYLGLDRRRHPLLLRRGDVGADPALTAAPERAAPDTKAAPETAVVRAEVGRPS